MSELEERRLQLEAELAALGTEEAELLAELEELPPDPVVTVKSPGKVK